jgi:hypothetical protein
LSNDTPVWVLSFSDTAYQHWWPMAYTDYRKLCPNNKAVVGQICKVPDCDWVPEEAL